MQINLPIFEELLLTIADKTKEQKVYPTCQLQKGLLMTCRGQDLSEEAVGFGLPILKQGLQTIFPGKVKLGFQQRGTTREVTAIYTMNLAEKIGRPGEASLKSKSLYNVKNNLAAFIRLVPLIRTPLMSLSSGLRALFGWETTYEEAGFHGEIRIVYTLHEPERLLLVEADTTALPQSSATEVIVMNEQGARAFDQYRDNSGNWLSGKAIGCWDEIFVQQASFFSSKARIIFTLPQVPGARLFRGRELVGSRLAWAGFGYVIHAPHRDFHYTVTIEKL